MYLSIGTEDSSELGLGRVTCRSEGWIAGCIMLKRLHMLHCTMG